MVHGHNTCSSIKMKYRYEIIHKVNLYPKPKLTATISNINGVISS
jgi:hypothetical protein